MLEVVLTKPKGLQCLFHPNIHSFMVQTTKYNFQGALQIPSHPFGYIDGTLMAPDGFEAWLPKTNSDPHKYQGMLLHRVGLIDGRREKWWNIHGRHDKAMIFASNSDLKLNALRIKNNPKFHFGFDHPNTSRIHLEETNNVKIYNSFISTGILFHKLSIPSSYLPYVFTIIKVHIVWACTFYAGDDCMSIGNNSHNVDIRNVTCSQICVRDSIIKHSTNGVQIKTWLGGLGFVSKVAFQNIHMDILSCPRKETYESILLESLWQNSHKYSSTSFLTSKEVTMSR
ncbi:polygalacturonase [Quercus suber]|uniref:Polygalacturonase n=1 Tax=Quercus suber TaxID=58331 RepID=A0AAW0IJY6_QUESU